MRVLILTGLSILLFSCNSSSEKKSGQAINDTASMEKLPLQLPKIEPVKTTAADIPNSIKLKGKVEEVWKWNDNLGENLFITTVVAPYDDKGKDQDEEDGQTAELYAFLFAKKEGEYKQVWMLTDAEKVCPFDITCELIKDAASITDLDQDGIAETTVQYKLACRSDVSPALMKLIMHEGEQKYALRGMMWYGIPEEKFEVTEKDVNLETLPGYKKTEEEYMKTFGRYESEKDFAGAPPEFIIYARQRWMKFVKESFE